MLDEWIQVTNICQRLNVYACCPTPNFGGEIVGAACADCGEVLAWMVMAIGDHFGISNDYDLWGSEQQEVVLQAIHAAEAQPGATYVATVDLVDLIFL